MPPETTRVDFYVLETSEPSARLRYACKLAEKAYKLDHVIHAHTNSGAEANALDNLLWTFRDGSFVPHELYASGAHPQPASPITIGYGEQHPPAGDVLIALTDAIPVFLTSSSGSRKSLMGQPRAGN